MPGASLSLIVSVCAVALAILATLVLDYMAGCARDLKGGTFGDPLRAYTLEGYGIAPFLMAIFGAAVICFVVLNGSLFVRAAASIGMFVLTAIVLTSTGMHLQAFGTRHAS